MHCQLERLVENHPGQDSAASVGREVIKIEPAATTSLAVFEATSPILRVFNAFCRVFSMGVQ